MRLSLSFPAVVPAMVAASLLAGCTTARATGPVQPLAPTAVTPVSEERLDWERARTGRYAENLIAFLLRHPESPHVPAAREMLLAKRLRPQGRLVEGGAACAAEMDARGRSLLAHHARNPLYAGHDIRWPDGELAARSMVEIAPRGRAAAEVPPEQLVALDVTARRDGGCSVHIRYSIGSGLPAACRCEPIDPTYRFESALARSVLAEYSGFVGAAAACGAGQAELRTQADAFLDEWVAMRTEWLDGMRQREANGRAPYPSERAELEDVAFALPVVRQRALQADVVETARARVAAMDPVASTAFCNERLPDDIQRARLRTLMSTKMRLGR